MADRDGERVGRVVRRRRCVEPQDRLHHALHLGLLRPAVAGDGELHVRRGVLSAADAGERGRDDCGAARLPDRERGAGVDADKRLLDCDGGRPLAVDELFHAVVDLQQALFRPLGRGGFPAPEVDRP